MAEDPAVVRLEEQVRTLFSQKEELKETIRDNHREVKLELSRLAGLIQNGQLTRHQIVEATEERKEIRKGQVACRAQCDDRFDEISDSVAQLSKWSENLKGRMFVVGVIVATILSILSSVGTALAIRLLDLSP